MLVETHYFVNDTVVSVNARVLQEVLGHTQIQVTLDIYGHVLREQKKETAQKVDAFLAAWQYGAR